MTISPTRPAPTANNRPDTGQDSCISQSAPAATSRAGAFAATQSTVAEAGGAPGRLLVIDRFNGTNRVLAVGEIALTLISTGAPRTASAFVSPISAALAVAYGCLGLGPGPLPSP